MTFTLKAVLCARTLTASWLRSQSNAVALAIWPQLQCCVCVFLRHVRNPHLLSIIVHFSTGNCVCVYVSKVVGELLSFVVYHWSGCNNVCVCVNAMIVFKNLIIVS